MKYLIVGAALVALGAQAAESKLLQQLQTCGMVKSHVSRLECYDNLAASQKLSDSGEQKSVTLFSSDAGGAASGDSGISQGSGDVQVSTADAAMVSSNSGWRRSGVVDKSLNLVLRVNTANSRVPGQVSLRVICQAGTDPELSIDWGVDLGSDVYVTTAVDSEDNQRGNWRSSVNGYVTSYPGDTRALLRRLETAAEFRAYIDFQGRPGKAVFSTSGLTAALADQRQLCGL